MILTDITNPDCTTLEDRRKHVRTDVNEPAYIYGDGSSMRCSVVNLTIDGAAIEVSGGPYVPSAFLLMTTKDRIVRSCRLVWTQNNRIGVAFVG